MSRVSGAAHCHYDSEEDAMSAYDEAVRANLVRVVPDVNHVLDHVCHLVLLL